MNSEDDGRFGSFLSRTEPGQNYLNEALLEESDIENPIYKAALAKALGLSFELEDDDYTPPVTLSGDSGQLTLDLEDDGTKVIYERDEDPVIDAVAERGLEASQYISQAFHKDYEEY